MKITILGLGHLGAAHCSAGYLKAGCAPGDITVYDRTPARFNRLRRHPHRLRTRRCRPRRRGLLHRTEMTRCFFALAPALAPEAEGRVFVSFMAGVPLEALRAALPGAAAAGPCPPSPLRAARASPLTQRRLRRYRSCWAPWATPLRWSRTGFERVNGLPPPAGSVLQRTCWMHSGGPGWLWAFRRRNVTGSQPRPSKTPWTGAGMRKRCAPWQRRAAPRSRACCTWTRRGSPGRSAMRCARPTSGCW